MLWLGHFFDKRSREIFKQELMCDNETWDRAKG